MYVHYICLQKKEFPIAHSCECRKSLMHDWMPPSVLCHYLILHMHQKFATIWKQSSDVSRPSVLLSIEPKCTWTFNLFEIFKQAHFKVHDKWPQAYTYMHMPNAVMLVGRLVPTTLNPSGLKITRPYWNMTWKLDMTLVPHSSTELCKSLDQWLQQQRWPISGFSY